MIFNTPSPEVIASQLFDETTFYQKLIQDLRESTNEVIIESPFITIERTLTLLPVFKHLVEKSVQLFVITRNPSEHDVNMSDQAEQVIQTFESLGIQVILCPGNHHRKIAMIDRHIVWEGSLNILSNSSSREIMRRIESNTLALDTFKFLKYERIVG
jgi:phosphatidylserine/phosphatidylglycerophosphate/cardiolipin synthase-like enzyme